MSDMATKVSLSNAFEERNGYFFLQMHYSKIWHTLVEVMPQPTHHSACMQLAKDVYYKVSTAPVDGYRTMYIISS